MIIFKKLRNSIYYPTFMTAHYKVDINNVIIFLNDIFDYYV